MLRFAARTSASGCTYPTTVALLYCLITDSRVVCAPATEAPASDVAARALGTIVRRHHWRVSMRSSTAVERGGRRAHERLVRFGGACVDPKDDSPTRRTLSSLFLTRHFS